MLESLCTKDQDDSNSKALLPPFTVKSTYHHYKNQYNALYNIENEYEQQPKY